MSVNGDQYIYLDLILTSKDVHNHGWLRVNNQTEKKGMLHVRAGLMVTERNWLEVYPYTKWGGNDSLPHLQEGQTFMPSHLMLNEVHHLGFLCTILAVSNHHP